MALQAALLVAAAAAAAAFCKLQTRHLAASRHGAVALLALVPAAKPAHAAAGLTPSSSCGWAQSLAPSNTPPYSAS